MNLQLFVSTLLKHRLLMASGTILGFIVLILSLYTVTFTLQESSTLPFELSPRKPSLYESTINLAVDSPGFGMARAGISSNSFPAFGRSRELAPTYSYLVASDFMVRRIGERAGGFIDGERVLSERVEDTPIFLVVVQSPDRQRATNITLTAVRELQRYVLETQVLEQTPINDRIIIRELGRPTEPTEVENFRSIRMVLAFLSPIFMAAIVAFLIENIERSPREGGKHAA